MNGASSVDNYDTIDHYDAIDDLVDDNYESIYDANYLELVATDTKKNVEDRHGANDANIAEERVCMPVSEFTNM